MLLFRSTSRYRRICSTSEAQDSWTVRFREWRKPQVPRVMCWALVLLGAEASALSLTAGAAPVHPRISMVLVSDS